jgi:ABC-type uncharacterized transport system substrate-binding protein
VPDPAGIAATGAEAPQPELSPIAIGARPRLPPAAVGGSAAEVLPEPPSVAIVISGRHPAYEAVALELGKRLDDAVIYDLADDRLSPATVFHRIGDSDTGAVVAIGLSAARAAVALATVPVVFCQVFNYRDAGLVTDTSRGVAALVPLDAQLDAWRDANPALTRIGLIIGPGHEDLLEEAQVAAADRALELDVAIVASDQEAQYHFRRMVHEIDGFWLFPDARVLSGRSLREMLAQARRRQVDVAVSNEALLALGASISIAPVPADIAATVIDLVRRIEGGQLGELPAITPLHAVQVATR